jgi:hypothetical protein
VERFWKWREETPDLEAELRAHRPIADDAFVQSISDRVRASRRSHATLRIAFALGLTTLMVAALGAFGGIGYAAQRAQHAATAATRVFDSPSSKPKAEKRSPAQDQYKTTICHRTRSAKHPWVEITVSNNALPAHQAHGDIIPAPPGGCPGS